MPSMRIQDSRNQIGAPRVSRAMHRAVLVVFALGCAHPALSPPVAERLVEARPMQGPFASRSEMCASLTCGVDEEGAPMTKDCPLPPPEDAGVEMASPPSPF